ncbi:hypothetical protein FQR65_LT00130 [Abscondita terminalis]|nr:hypothetical protein FQR65_LT00130 [Abscondita terminalis]
MKTASILVAIILLCVSASAIPFSRLKRVSDQRLAELETLVALSKMSGKLVTVPLGLGKVDPKIIGRKRRSQLDALLNHSVEEDAGDPGENYFGLGKK